MRGLRRRQIEADRIVRRRNPESRCGGGGPIRDGEEGEDRNLLRDVVGPKRGVQHLQQEGPERLPFPMADLDSLARLWVPHHVRLLGGQDRRAAED